MKVYIVKYIPLCEGGGSGETCQCHDYAFEIVKIFTDKAKADAYVLGHFGHFIDEYDVEE